MSDEYLKAITDELERIADLLEFQARLKVAELQKNGITELPRLPHRKVTETKSARITQAAKPQQP